MKAKFKKLMAVALSAVMAMTMCVASQVKAAENATLTMKVANSLETLDGRTFNAYQLFNVKKDGKNYIYTDVTPELTKAVIQVIKDTHAAYNKAQEPDMAALPEMKTAGDVTSFFANAKWNAGTNEEFMAIFSKNFKKAEKTIGDATVLNKGNKFTATVPYGYYVILEDVTSIKDKDYMASAPILYTIAEANLEIDVKADMPSVTKKIVDTDGTRVDNNDYSMGDLVEFELVGKVPATSVLDQYKTYQYQFNDTFTTSLDAPELTTFTVKVGNKQLKVDGNNIKDGDAIVGTIAISGQTFTVKFNDLIPYKATLGEKAEIVVTYKAKLNQNAVLGSKTEANENKVDIQFSNNPHFDGEGDLGKSPEDIVHVYTTGMSIVKVDGVTGDSLSGAQFKVTTDAEGKDEVKFSGSKGSYKVDATGSAVVEVSDNTLQEGQELGTLYLNGLGEGTYYLHETKAPEGYNVLPKPITVVVTAKYENKGVEGKEKFVGFTYTIDGKVVNENESGQVDFKVENNSGAQLPETGGMGTTLLYVVGIIAMAAGACYFAMDKKRKAQ